MPDQIDPSYPRQHAHDLKQVVVFECLESPELCGSVLDGVNTAGTRHFDRQSMRWHDAARRKTHFWNGYATVYE